ncbi:hypothetical protein [Mycolicibacterium mucogenicum]|uniref:hypothetical protein n=1 Tax=Mycolicibacterium mucogenicum TaxID=56689 RepID=UPI00076ABDCC|nr:hypothetical protein [Mycolicibacterium mucogenicum]
MARRKQGFVRNHKAIGRIMRSQQVAEFVHDVVAPVAEKHGLTVDDYITDRRVSALVGEAEDQAKDGKVTKAAGEAGWSVR